MSLRFGIFEFHPITRELYREGTQVRLQAQPAQVLELLLRNAGEVVTRTQLKEIVWGSETFVDFDKGLNFCIAQVRSALGDSAEAPIYIRTIPKHGYQFIAPVSCFGEDRPENIRVSPSPRIPLRLQKMWLPTLAVLVVLGGLIVAWQYGSLNGRQHAISLQATRVAVARFDNETGDAEFDRLADALSDSVTAKLTISGIGRYGVIGNAAILRVPRSHRDLIAIGSTLNAGYVVLAQVRRDSSHFFVLAHLIHLPDQTHIAVTELACSTDDSLQDQSDMAQRISDKFSPLILRPIAVEPPHKTL